MRFFLEGLALGLAYAMPIGSQNIFVIHSAANEGLPRSLRTALLISIMDVSLAIACFMGLGMILQQLPILRLLLLGGGAVFLINFGFRLIRKHPDSVTSGHPIALNFITVLRSSFVLTWFNPHALIDGSLLFGTYRASLPPAGFAPFILGMAIASPLWFFSLTCIVGGFRSQLPKSFFRALNIGCALVLFIFGLNLAYQFLKGCLS
jgi:L-lysine exporter family protein LysE/ArgO